MSSMFLCQNSLFTQFQGLRTIVKITKERNHKISFRYDGPYTSARDTTRTALHRFGRRISVDKTSYPNLHVAPLPLQYCTPAGN